MNNFTFYSPTEFVFGRKTEDKTGKLCKEYNANKVLIVYGGNSAIKSGLLEKIRTSLTSEHISFFELGGVEPNPTDRYGYDGIKIVRENNIDFILAVGGGSVIDTAKAIAAGAKYNSDCWDFFISKVVINKAIKIGVVLTITDAGSKGSGKCVITQRSTVEKLRV